MPKLPKTDNIIQQDRNSLRWLGLISLSILLVACQKEQLQVEVRPSVNSEQAVEANVPCQSFNLGDNLQPSLGLGSLQLNVPVARLKERNQGHAVVLLATTDSSIGLFWLRQNNQGQWSITEKQTVVQLRPRHLDASPLHRLQHNAKQQKVVLFITLPSAYWQKGVTIQPVLEETESRWGKVQSFNTQITAQGLIHPFLGLDRGLSGNTLPPRLAEVMNQIEAGSIYVPRIYTSKINLLKPSLVNRNLCPLAGS